MHFFFAARFVHVIDTASIQRGVGSMQLLCVCPSHPFAVLTFYKAVNDVQLPSVLRHLVGRQEEDPARRN